MDEILNYVQVNEHIATSGQPTSKQLELISKSGYEVVINLAMHDATNALDNEDWHVSALGMNYIHIPVPFEDPTLNHLKLFRHILESLKDKKVWIHCAKNYRVTAFMYDYQLNILEKEEDNIDLSVLDEWKPSKKWEDIMSEVLNSK